MSPSAEEVLFRDWLKRHEGVEFFVYQSKLHGRRFVKFVEVASFHYQSVVVDDVIEENYFYRAPYGRLHPTTEMQIIAFMACEETK